MTIDASLDTSVSPFLQGLMAPVTDERDDGDLRIEGELPEGLQGTFVRNGPNPAFTPPGAYHPFDGDGMLHAVTIGDGAARYRNRWIESKGLAVERRMGAAVYGGLAEFRVPSPEVVAEAGIIKNTANTHTVRHAGRMLALMEAGLPTEITDGLDTVGEYDFDGRLVGPMTAHPKLDPHSGELVFFGYSPLPPFLRYHVADTTGALIHSEVIDLPASVMMHDFVVTEHHTVFLDAPAIFDVVALSKGEPALRWEPERGTRLGVLPRFGTNADVRWFDIPDCYVVHFFNAWEEGNRLEIRAPRFERVPGGFEFDAPTTSIPPVPWQWSIDLEAGTVTETQLDDRSGEFPRVNDDHATRPTRFGYNTLARSWELDFDFDGVVRYDFETGAATSYRHGATAVCGEHVVAPDPAGTGEEDAWLLSMVADRATDECHLAVLDARDVAAGPVACIHLPRRVPLGFHANWFPAG
ncbi:MAG: carotenoid oxygenase family protein [Acidimicrobiia bacterium]|nr:carotenoid oxygenase family protein [Acidimicrobiia bacterium]